MAIEVKKYFVELHNGSGFIVYSKTLEGAWLLAERYYSTSEIKSVAGK